MIEQGLIIALIVLSIHYTLQRGEIFGSVGDWLEKHTPSAIHNPLFACNVCMAPWYGSIVYWVLFGTHWLQWLAVIIIAMGFNIVINKWSPPDEIEINDKK